MSFATDTSGNLSRKIAPCISKMLFSIDIIIEIISIQHEGHILMTVTHISLCNAGGEPSARLVYHIKLVLSNDILGLVL
jgi:hypothetical protein